MKFLLYAIIPIVITLILPFMFLIMRKNARKQEKRLNANNFTMQASKKYAIAMTMLAIIFSVCIAIFCMFVKFEKIYMQVLCMITMSLFEILIILGCIQAYRQKIVIVGEKIKYTPTLGKSQTYSMNVISKVVLKYDRNMTKYLVYSNCKKLFEFSSIATGSELLLELFEKNNIQLVDK